MQIFPLSDVDMFGVFKWAVLGGRGRVLTFIFGTLIFATSGILSMHEQLATLKREMKSHHMTP